MSPEQFSQQLADEGYTQVVTVERTAGELAEHAHPFAAKALILAGEMTPKVAGRVTVYQAGQIFHLPADTPHSESY
ncbi:MAG TPA: cupin domain-containing protein [Azospira sp.]|nr:cupin domain-containing protein [Azospira sp.]